MDHLTRLYRIRKTCLEMLGDRDYIITAVSYLIIPFLIYDFWACITLLLANLAVYHQLDLLRNAISLISTRFTH